VRVVAVQPARIPAAVQPGLSPVVQNAVAVAAELVHRQYFGRSQANSHTPIARTANGRR
jgi:hypothetical protein